VADYKGPASLDELRAILRNNDQFHYLDDEEFLGWARAFRVWRKSDNTVQLLYYASPDRKDDGWRWFETVPWDRYS
jgi:hypothetical protein